MNSNDTWLMISSVGTCDLRQNLAYVLLFPLSFLLNTQLPPLIMIHLPSFVKFEGSLALLEMKLLLSLSVMSSGAMQAVLLMCVCIFPLVTESRFPIL